MGLLVGLAFDIKPRKVPKGSPDDLWAEHDSEETISAVEEALNSGGNRAIRIGSSRRLLSGSSSLKCDIVFNIAEGISGRNRESEVPVLLDIAGIPYAGSDALTLSISLDKIISKKIFMYHKIPTPAYFECVRGGGISVPKGLKFPFMVKPRYEGSAKGIDAGSVVRDMPSLGRQVDKVVKRYGQPVLVEEFIDGWEFTVGIIGNRDPVVLPVVQRHVEAETGLSSHIFDKTCADKQSLRYRDLLDIDAGLEERIKRLALGAFRGLGCRDFARIDFRVNPKRQVYMLEINPLPSLARDDYFAMVAELMGITYERMINMMFGAALDRCGLR
ncbi:MAG: ATP-grasp domain-containing protein [Candidatus Omnitrophica bacterium]|nr:ATP-grasp domain-containing protein [Candidatus Omnitrophota bacterium]